MEKSLEENLKEAPPRFFMPLREKKKNIPSTGQGQGGGSSGILILVGRSAVIG